MTAARQPLSFAPIPSILPVVALETAAPPSGDGTSLHTFKRRITQNLNYYITMFLG